MQKIHFSNNFLDLKCQFNDWHFNFLVDKKLEEIYKHLQSKKWLLLVETQ